MAECFGGPTNVENKTRLAATHWCRQVERVKVSTGNTFFGPWGSKMVKKIGHMECFKISGDGTTFEHIIANMALRHPGLGEPFTRPLVHNQLTQCN